MNIHNVASFASLDYFSLLNYPNNVNNDSSVPALDFQKILSTATRKTEKSEKTSTFVNAEQSLKEIYPDLKYHVLDASQFKYWNRLDFPTSKLFKDKIDENTINELRAWKPQAQTATGYEPWVQRDLEKIQQGLHVVMIHPAVQEKMDKDPGYAKQIVAKIQKYFKNDIQLNAAIDPESVKSMSQLVTISEDGEIGFHQTVCDGPSKQENGSEEIFGTKKDKKKQYPLSALQTMAITYSLPLPEQITTTLEYDYSYAYGLYGLYQKRKTGSNED